VRANTVTTGAVSVDTSLGPDPFAIFLAWYDEAVKSGAPLPDSMALATADAGGRPSVRVVLYKGITGGGVRFFTNYESRKGRDLRDNARGALAFYWATLHRQVRMEGAVSRLATEESDEYFATRPRESQIGAWASPQSEPLASYAELDERVRAIEARFSGRAVERPPFWGGYRLVPERFEFWIGREHRLHDRFAYDRDGTGWLAMRLAP
jgi:pyridoxamine 5'-phosphate oxidase